MLSKYIPKRYATAMLKHVVAVSLFFPYVYSKSANFFYADFILANFFAILAMIFILTSWKLDFKKNGILLAGMGILLIAYNVCATYMNYNYHHWYGEQINTTISFLLFMVLLMVKEPHALIDTATIRSIIHMMVITNVISIAYRLFTGYNSLFFMNDYAKTVTNFEETADQYSWLYLHKSQYALILVVCIAFCVVYRKIFRNIVTYLMALGVLLYSLYLSDTYTSMAAVALIFVGQFLDCLLKANWWKKLVALFLIIILGLIFCNILYEIFSKNRNLLTLNDRTLIWKASCENIINNPYGMINFEMGIDSFNYNILPNGWFQGTYNCHNVFLNHMFRFSILVGCIFLLLYLFIFIFSLIQNTRFLCIGIYFSITIPLCMDYSMLCSELTLILLMLYFLFFHNNQHNIIST